MVEQAQIPRAPVTQQTDPGLGDMDRQRELFAEQAVKKERRRSQLMSEHQKRQALILEEYCAAGRDPATTKKSQPEVRPDEGSRTTWRSSLILREAANIASNNPER